MYNVKKAKIVFISQTFFNYKFINLILLNEDN